MRWFLNFLYGSTPAEFESEFGLDESVLRLAAATRRTVFAYFLPEQSAVGRVTTGCVSLQRIIPFVGNSFKPYFRGSFEEVGGRVRLRGEFTMHPLVKLFQSIWFGFVAIWVLVVTVITIGALLTGRPCIWWLPFAGVGMFLLGLGIVALGKWFARNDIRWLSAVIQDALRK